jgi:NADPH:quinone reductase-like Zn-dependent oxidoreductase
VIDYTTDDVAVSGRRWDLIFQLAGTRSARDCRRSLTARGTVLLSSGESEGHVLGPLVRMAAGPVLSPFVRQRLRMFVAERSGEDLDLLRSLIEAGTIRPVVDRVYPLAETADAIRHLEEGHARGKTVITM